MLIKIEHHLWMFIFCSHAGLDPASRRSKTFITLDSGFRRNDDLLLAKPYFYT